MRYCGVVEVRSLEDALGATCGRSAKARCSDCGAGLCPAHTERCSLCEATFCPSCLSFHENEHPKPSQRDRGVREKRRRPDPADQIETPASLAADTFACSLDTDLGVLCRPAKYAIIGLPDLLAVWRQFMKRLALGFALGLLLSLATTSTRAQESNSATDDASPYSYGQKLY